MRLAYVTNVSMPAGDAQSIQVQAMAKSFAMKLGNDFLLVSSRNKINSGMTSDYVWKRVRAPLFLPRAIRYALLIVRSTFLSFKFKPDFVYTRDIGVAVWYMLLGFKAAYETHKPFETKIGGWLFRRFASKIKIVAISEALKKYICEKYGVNPKDILVAHDGVFLEDFPVISAQERDKLKQKLYNSSPGEFVVTYAGSTQHGKGVDLMEKVAGTVSEKIPRAKFFIVGGQSDETSDDVRSPIRYLGRKPHGDIPQYLQAADLVIFTNTAALAYYKYTSPLKLFEYMASGAPITASNIGSASEIINDGNAFVFNPADVGASVSAVCRALNNRAEAGEKALKARHDVENFTWSNRVSHVISFLSQR